MNPDLNNAYFTGYLWISGQKGFPPFEPGALLLMRDNLCGSITRPVIKIAQLLHRSEQASCIHAAILLKAKVEEGKAELELAEASGGSGGVQINPYEFGKTDYRMVVVIVPKSESLRKAIVACAERTASKQSEKMGYALKNVITSVFKGEVPFDEEAKEKVAGVVVDTLQDRQWHAASGEVLSEFCSSYVLLVLQASYVLEKIPEKDRLMLSCFPREAAVEMVARYYFDGAIPEWFMQPAETVTPGTLYDRLVFSKFVVDG